MASRILQAPRTRVGLSLRLRRAFARARRTTARTLQAAGIAFLVIGTSAASATLVFSVTRSSYFRVREVKVRGTTQISRAEVARIIGLSRGVSIFAIPARRQERAIARNPWVARVVVRRQFPDRVLVDVTERRPCAIVKLGSLFYVDRQGVVFKRLVRGDDADFPVITGLRPADLSVPEGRELLARALELQRLLERDPHFGMKRISEIHASQDSGVSVITTGDPMTIRFGLDNFPVKMESLGKLLQHIEQQRVKVRVIDLSFHNMAVLEPADEADDRNTVGL